MTVKTSEEARRDFRQLLNAAERGHHIDITRYTEPVAVLVPYLWHETVFELLRDLWQAEAGWDAHIPLDALRERARIATELIAPIIDDDEPEFRESHEARVRRYVERVTAGQHSDDDWDFSTYPDPDE